MAHPLDADTASVRSAPRTLLWSLRNAAANAIRPALLGVDITYAGIATQRVLYRASCRLFQPRYNVAVGVQSDGDAGMTDHCLTSLVVRSVP